MIRREIRSGIRRIFRLDLHRPADAGPDADLELETMIEEEVRHLMARGVSQEAARAAAVARLGPGPDQTRNRIRRSAERRERTIRWRDWAADAISDGRLSIRSLRRSPGFAAAAIVTLAIAIGANTSIFSAVDAVLLRPLPFSDPDRLVAVWEENPNFGWYQQTAAPANWFDWKEQAAGFTDVAAHASFVDGVTLTGFGEPVLLRQLPVTGNLLSVLGIHPGLGRGFEDQDTWQSGGTPSVMVSDAAWRTRFGADPGLVGRTIQLDGSAAQVIGVLPRGLEIPGLEFEIWRTFGFPRERWSQARFRRAHWLNVIARLKPGISFGQANASLQVVVARLQRDYPETNTRMGAGITPLHQFLMGKTRLPLLVMLGAVAVLLLIGCANVANLLLVRAAGRDREVALRLALGAGRGRLLRQSLAESVVLAGLGGIAGLGLGWWGTSMLSAIRPESLLPVRRITMSLTVIGYVSLATTLAAVIFGLAPLARARRRAPADALREAGRSLGGGVGDGRFADGLLIAQVALALALTLGAGLLTRSYLGLVQVDPGFDPSNVLTVRLGLSSLRYDTDEKVVAFYDQLRREAATLGGVETVATISKVPLGPASWTSEFAVAGREPLPAGSEILHREPSAGYFETMRVPLLAGRAIDETDRRDSPPVVVINQTFARTYFPGQDPIGQRISFDRLADSSSVWRTIVGVVGDERQTALSQVARPEAFSPMSQQAREGMSLLLRTREAPEKVVPAIRAVIARLDPALAIASISTMDEVWRKSLARDRFLMALVASFAVVGLMLGLVGVYGVVAQVARRRNHEMGIRIALGARAGQVTWLVVRRGVLLAGFGIALGAGGALTAAGLIRTLLYQVAPADPATFIAVPLLVLGTAALASWIPALRASRADPCQVLRSD